MDLAFIKFKNREDAARAIHEVTRYGRADGYRGGVWVVHRDQLKLIEDLGIEYLLASEDEIEAARGSIRSPAPSIL